MKTSLAMACVHRVRRFFSPCSRKSLSCASVAPGPRSFRFGAAEGKLLAIVIAGLISVGLPLSLAAPLSGARITHIVNDVKTVDTGKPPRPSNVNELVEGGRAVRTGIDSRTELLFSDQTITRLGANSHFSFSDGNRELSFSQGMLLLQVPKGAGGAKIQTAAVTAAITGTTILFEVGLVFTTLTVVEGKCFLSLNADRLHRKTAVNAGQRVSVNNNATTIPAPAKIKISDIVKTSPMFTAGWSAQLDQTEIAAAIAAQLHPQSGEIGILRVKGAALINRKPAQNGDVIHSGDVIETAADQTAIIDLGGRSEIAIAKSTRVRLGGGGTGPVTTYVIFGHIERHGLLNTEDVSADGSDSTPYFSLFGFSNFPAGGNSSPNGGILSVVLPDGRIALYDSLYNFIRFQ